MTANISTLTPPQSASSPTHFPTPKLFVHKLDPEDYEKYTKDIICLWIQSVDDAKHLKLDEETRNRLLDCQTVCKALSNNLDSYSEDPAIQLFACYDDQERVQGMMTYMEEEEYIEIQELVTNPWNIAPKIVPNAHPVKGAGKALMRKAILEKKTITLAAYPGAKSFYQSLGFQPASNRTDTGCVHLVLERKINAVYLKTKKAA